MLCHEVTAFILDIVDFGESALPSVSVSACTLTNILQIYSQYNMTQTIVVGSAMRMWRMNQRTSLSLSKIDSVLLY